MSTETAPLYLKPIDVVNPVTVVGPGDPGKAEYASAWTHKGRNYVKIEFADHAAFEFDGAWLRAQAEMRR